MLARSACKAPFSSYVTGQASDLPVLEQRRAARCSGRLEGDPSTRVSTGYNPGGPWSSRCRPHNGM